MHNFFEFYGQIFWLYLCILFDFFYERLFEFDYITDINPFSEVIYQIIEFFRSLLSGKESENLVSHIMNFTDRDFMEDIDEDDYTHFGSNSDNFGDDSSHGLSEIDDFDSFEFLGWGFNINIGTDPGNEFSSINDLVELPSQIEKLLLTDISDFYQNLFGLDSPKIGDIAPSFDITIPINSLWLINVVYYNPIFGGMLFIDFNAFFEFLKIIYLDRRISFFSKIYSIIDYSIFNYNENLFLFLKLKINYIYIDIFQIIDSIYFNPIDFLYFIWFYFIYILNYCGIWLPIAILVVNIYYSKLNVYFEKKGRLYNSNSIWIINILSNSYNYMLFRFLYFFLSNCFLFLKMSFTILLILTIINIFSEGFHIFSVLKVYSSDQESLYYTNGLFFNLERDPFVEKHNPIDEVWDQFKYESTIDDEWSRIHFNRENTEILGGSMLENPSVIDSIGFSKKFNFMHYLNELDSEFNSSVSKLTRAIPQQIHNHTIDEESYTPRFIKDTVLEREFFRESELYGPEIEGSLDWYNRTLNTIDNLQDIRKFNVWFRKKHIIESDNYSFLNWGYSSDNEDYNNDLYDALLSNIADPKWLYNESNIQSEMVKKPIIFNHSKSQLNNQLYEKNVANLNSTMSSNFKLINLIERNKGITHQSPILDFNDENPHFDLGIDNYLLYGSSIGTSSNSESIYDDVMSDIVTQKNKYSNDILINQSLFFNFVNKDDKLPIDYSKTENILLENFFDTIFKTKLNKNSLKNYSSITENYNNKFRRKRVDNFYNIDNFHSKMGKNWILENNFKIQKLVKDSIPEGYFNITSYVFKDLSNQIDDDIDIKNNQNLSLENIRRRDIKNINLEGKNPSTIFYDEMLGDEIDKLTYVNLSNIKHPLHSHNTKLFINNEYFIKFDMNSPNSQWTSIRWPRTRWKWFRKWGFDSPYQDYIANDQDEDNISENAAEGDKEKKNKKKKKGNKKSE